MRASSTFREDAAMPALASSTFRSAPRETARSTSDRTAMAEMDGSRMDTTPDATQHHDIGTKYHARELPAQRIGDHGAQGHQHGEGVACHDNRRHGSQVCS